MNSGWLVLLIILGTIGAGITVTIYRDLIFTPGGTSRPQDSSWRPRRPPARQPAPARGEMGSKWGESISGKVSGTALPDNDAEMVALRALVKLINAGLITETAALQTVFGVKAGSSKDYKRVQEKLKIAQAEIAGASKS